jgi:hypothetical protein
MQTAPRLVQEAHCINVFAFSALEEPIGSPKNSASKSGLRESKPAEWIIAIIQNEF